MIQIYASIMKNNNSSNFAHYQINNELHPSDAKIDIQELAKYVKKNSSITLINLSGNNISKGINYLPEALKIDNTLTSINLYNSNIDAKGLKHLSETLKKNSSITSLDLSCNNIDAKGIECLSEALNTNNTITMLNLHNNNISNKGISCLSGVLKTNSSITSIDLYKNNISDIEHLSELLKKNSSITSIDLSGNNIDAKGLEHLSEALKINNTLTSINLYNNNINAKGLEHLSELLKKNSSITSIDLSGNNIEAKGLEHLSEALKINNTLTSIDLLGNNIGNKGIEYLSELLKKNSSITSITLGYNGISDKGIKCLFEVLKTNSSIASINLYGNNISDTMIKTIDSLIENNRFLKKESDKIVENIFNLSQGILNIDQLDPEVQKLVQIKLAKTLDQKINNLSKESLIELNKSIYDTYHESEIFDNTCAIMYEETKEICDLRLYQHFLKLKFANLGKEFLNKMDKIFSDSRDSLLKQDLVQLLQYLDPQENPIAKQSDIFEANEFERSKSFMELLRNRPMKVIIEELTNLDLQNLIESDTKNWELIVNAISKIKVNLNKESTWTKDILNIPIFYNEIELPDNSGIVEYTKIERNHIGYEELQRLEWEKKKRIEKYEKKLLKKDWGEILEAGKQEEVDIEYFAVNILGKTPGVQTDVVKTSGDQDVSQEVDSQL